MKQTAVDWLVDQIENFNCMRLGLIPSNIIEQAKEMEKEQISAQQALEVYEQTHFYGDFGNENMGNNTTNQMKQTAVDWLFNRLWETPKDKLTWHSILEEAMQREKMQIESAHRHGASDFILHRYKMEQYYKDTYGEE